MRGRLTIRGLMFAVLLAGVSMAAFRVYPALGFILAGVLSIALARTIRGIVRSPLIETMPPWATIRTFFTSMVVGSTMILISLLPVLLVFPGLKYAWFHRYEDFNFDSFVGVLISALLAIPIARLIKRCNR